VAGAVGGQGAPVVVRQVARVVVHREARAGAGHQLAEAGVHLVAEEPVVRQAVAEAVFHPQREPFQQASEEARAPGDWPDVHLVGAARVVRQVEAAQDAPRQDDRVLEVPVSYRQAEVVLALAVLALQGSAMAA
jgi:hypothetical protein